jgi:predicted amidophosphoribosyltransferase
MPTVREYTEPLIPALRRVLPVGPGVCNVCHGAPNVPWERCYSCDQTIGQVSRPVEIVVPISLSDKEGQFYHLLKAYKGYFATPAQRAMLGSVIARFLDKHGHCITAVGGGDWDTITIVPSSGERGGSHPLEFVVSRVATLLGQEYRALLTKGDASISHNRADDSGYRLTGEARGRRVLLVDDTFTTGARVQSAASALQLGGARVIAAVVTGRIINPGWNDACRELWARAGQAAFSFDVCCLE